MQIGFFLFSKFSSINSPRCCGAVRLNEIDLTSLQIFFIWKAQSFGYILILNSRF